MAKENFKVTPWEVSGKIDYDRLIKKFGSKEIDNHLMDRIKKHTKDLHFMLTRGIFYSHRDMNFILDEYEKGNKFFLYTGRGPSGQTHLGHMLPWIFTKWLQDKFDVELYFQITEDEKALVKNLTLEETSKIAYDNVLDIIALGFDPKKTHIFLDTEYSNTLYKMAIRVSKHLTFSTVKAVFGFTDSTNIGLSFFPAMQIAPCFIPSNKADKNIPCLIPASIDQDDYWRPARDVAPKLGYYKPAQIHSKFVPSLQGPHAKMSSSDPRTAIFTTDTPEIAEKKIMNAFTGQQATAELQRKLGGDPDKCSICQYYFFLFEENDKKVKKIFEAERSGELLAGEHKADLAHRVKRFIDKHQKKREIAKKHVEKFMLRD